MNVLVPRNVATLVFIVALVFALLPLPASAEQRPGAEAQFHELINDLRLSVGLEPLALHPELEAEALRWTEEVAAAGAIRHDSDLSVGVSERWSLLGENVGTTNETVQVLFDAFVASPTHYDNLVEPTFDTIGIAVVAVADGRIYTVHRFMDITGEARVVAPPDAVGAVEAPATVGPFDPSVVARVVDELDRAGI